MDEQRLKGLLGLCARSRQITYGEDACRKALRSGKAAVLVLDAEASPATRERYERLCEAAAVPLLPLPAGLLWEATGHSGVAAAIAPGGLADAILK